MTGPSRSDPTSGRPARPPASSAGLGLVPLDCPTCGAALAAAGEDVVFYCSACRNGYRYQPETPHLVPLEVQFVAAAHVVAERYLPFWKLEAEVEIRNRQGGRAPRDLMRSLFGGGVSPTASGAVRFVVPAFQADLDSAVELARRYTREFPGLDELLGEKLIGGCYGVEDAQTLAHFALIAAEVDKPDVLRAFDYSIRFGGSRLLGVPFARDGETWKDAVFGVRALDVDSR
ncbi:MAG: hypothetical protein ACE5GX_19285 [Thermoanaerobaculia bacterium]